jgi:hypothetical protein
MNATGSRLMPAAFRNRVCNRAGSGDSPNPRGSQPCLRMFRSEQHGDRARGDLRAVLSIIPYEHKNDAVRIVNDTRETSSAAGFRSEFDQATFTSMAHSPTLAVISERTNSRATVGNRVRPGSKNSLSSRASWGTRPREQETLGQRSPANFLKETLNGAVVNLSHLSEKHCLR